MSLSPSFEIPGNISVIRVSILKMEYWIRLGLVDGFRMEGCGNIISQSEVVNLKSHCFRNSDIVYDLLCKRWTATLKYTQTSLELRTEGSSFLN